MNRGKVDELKSCIHDTILLTMILLCIALYPGCSSYIKTAGNVNGVVGSVSSTGVGTLTTNGSDTSVVFTAPSGSAYISLTVDLGNFSASNVCSTATILSTVGSASCAVTGTSVVVSINSILDSNLFRDAGSSQITQLQETTTYGGGQGSVGSNLPSNYHNVPDVNNDDEGYCTADSTVVGGCTVSTLPTSPITWAQHYAFSNCGYPAVMAGSGFDSTTISGRIAHCKSVNGAMALWQGSAGGNSGEGNWSLVTRMSPDTTSGACSLGTVTSCVLKEVWQDLRTQNLWSSKVAGATNVSGTALGGGSGFDNWCKASGNTQNVGGINCSAGGGYQPATPVSYCAEVLAPALSTENWVANTPGAYTYDVAKGSMGRYSSPTVRWSLPTIHQFEQAEVDGIRRVMPDMGPLQEYVEWSATVVSHARNNAWFFYSYDGDVDNFHRSSSYGVRCVGH